MPMIMWNPQKILLKHWSLCMLYVHYELYWIKHVVLTAYLPPARFFDLRNPGRLVPDKSNRLTCGRHCMRKARFVSGSSYNTTSSIPWLTSRALQVTNHGIKQVLHSTNQQHAATVLVIIDYMLDLGGFIRVNNLMMYIISIWVLK